MTSGLHEGHRTYPAGQERCLLVAAHLAPKAWRLHELDLGSTRLLSMPRWKGKGLRGLQLAFTHWCLGVRRVLQGIKRIADDWSNCRQCRHAKGREAILLASSGPEDDCEERLEQEPDAQEGDDYLSHS